jgi:coenzyme F420-dependent glucose-6-phosphate dehydrogenase
MRLGIHASQELFSPSELLRRMQQADQNGFLYASTSDHFHPWTTDQGHAGFAWAWLGAALATTSMTFGIVTCPGQRYHPAILAQAAATLDQMYPHRFWLALGSGEALNEKITGQPWPPKASRHQRLLECVDIIRRLWSGQTVTHRGEVQVEQARLFTRPSGRIPIYGAALTPPTAAWCADWADGLITAGSEISNLRKNISAFRSNGGQGKQIVVQTMVCLAKSEEEALEITRQRWRVAALETQELAELSTPLEFDHRTASISVDDLRGRVLFVANVKALEEWLFEASTLGIDKVYLHHIGNENEELMSIAKLYPCN